MSRVIELFGQSTVSARLGTESLFVAEGRRTPDREWAARLEEQPCPYLGRTCLKVRKSSPEISIGTCAVAYGREYRPIAICPHRLLERRQIFLDCLHLLSLHDPGNELHVVPEISVPGGSVDYCVASVRKGRVVDFVGVELQTLDTTGTVWPARQRFLRSVGVPVDDADADSRKSFGMNWKMTAKTILVQLHHKLETFEDLGKHLVLVVQDELLEYMNSNFSMGHFNDARQADPMHFHAYELEQVADGHSLSLRYRRSTDIAGVAAALGLQAEARMDHDELAKRIEAKLSDSTRLILG